MRPSASFLRAPVRSFRRHGAGYPPVLTEIDAAVRGFAAPEVLHLAGQWPALAPGGRAVAVVGARACTPHGRAIAHRLGAGLAARGITVVSGAARGIDQAAMRGALEAGGPVLAVLGSGLRHPYPPDALPLLQEVIDGDGGVCSEFPLQAAPRRHHFPRRNRLLAAFCQGVVVVEAGPHSGSMNTARWGLDLGREVCAVPGPAGGPASVGPHRLLREGAALVEAACDVVEALRFDDLLPSPPSPPSTPARPPLPAASADLLSAPEAPAPRPAGDRARLLAQFRGTARDFDSLHADTGLSHDRLRRLLAECELAGVLVRLPGGLYDHVRPRHRP